MAATTSTTAATLKRAPSPKRVPSQMPRVEELTCSTSPDPPSAPKPEGVAPPQDLALVQRRQPPPPPGFSPQDPDDLVMPPLEDTHLSQAMTLLDLSALELLEMSILHTPAKGEVHYHLQAQSFTRMSLLSTSSQGQLGPSPKVKEPWVIIILCYIMETPVPSNDLSK